MPPPRDMEGTAIDASKLFREILGLFLVFSGLFLCVCLFSYNAGDPSLNQAVHEGYVIRNLAGVIGSFTAGLLVDFFGLGAFGLPFVCFYLGLTSFRHGLVMPWWRAVGIVLIIITLTTWAASPWSLDRLSISGITGGGLFGGELFNWSSFLLSTVGAGVVWGFVMLVAIQLTLGFSWILTGQEVGSGVSGWFGPRDDEDLNALHGLPPESALAEEPAQPVAKILSFERKRPKREAPVLEAEPVAPPKPSRKKAEPERIVDLVETLPAEPANPAEPEPADEGPRPSWRALFSRTRKETAPESDDAKPVDSAPIPEISLTDFLAAQQPAPQQPVEPHAAPQVTPSPVVAESLTNEAPEPPEAPQEAAPQAKVSFLSRLLRRGQQNERPAAASQPAQARPEGQTAEQGGDMEDISFADLFRNHSMEVDVDPSELPSASAGSEATGDAQELTWVNALPEPEEAAAPEPAPATTKASVVAPQRTAPVATPRPAKQAPVRTVPQDSPLPTLELLSQPSGGPSGPDMARLEAQAQALMSTLGDFGVQGEVQRIVPGPVVTMFEYKPAPGVKLARITGLTDDLAMALRALAVRIDAIPGKDLVGIEIPNEERQTVQLREIMQSEVFGKSASKLTLALGKDIQGQPYAADLARMPHLLVAGATGAGKSVCLNGILLSILYKATPAEVRLLLIDPKRIELSMYGNLPHLVHPVVTEMAMAKTALEWAVAEMERRYEAMARLTVRNIDSYNEKLAGMDADNHPELSELIDLGPMPFLVIIIDELADLMMTAAKEAELAIVRLAQLARAAGIHLILATQRPSVDVVTGLIKANFPTRIAFQVTSKHDSRTILDTVGAERLLGRGDMLYKPSGGKFKRLHGAFVSEAEIERVVAFWKAKAPQRFELDFSTWQSGQDEGPDGEGGGEALLDDPLYTDAVDFVTSQGKASISLIQRRFKIGFNRAARMVEQMEMDGLLGPADGAKPRSVIRGRD